MIEVPLIFPESVIVPTHPRLELIFNMELELLQTATKKRHRRGGFTEWQAGTPGKLFDDFE